MISDTRRKPVPSELGAERNVSLAPASVVEMVDVGLCRCFTNLHTDGRTIGTYRLENLVGTIEIP